MRAYQLDDQTIDAWTCWRKGHPLCDLNLYFPSKVLRGIMWLMSNLLYISTHDELMGGSDSSQPVCVVAKAKIAENRAARTFDRDFPVDR